MSRSNYSEGLDSWEHIMWRGAVASASNGKRGQAFFREMLAALEALPVKRLIPSALVCADGVCAMGAVSLYRGQDVSNVNPDVSRQVAEAFGIARALAAEIAFENDDDFGNHTTDETPEQRWTRMHEWCAKQIVGPL